MAQINTSSGRVFRFGLFEADIANSLLARKGVRISLQEQPFRILTILLERAGQTVTREELREELWPAGTYVDFDGSLNAALKRLRAALGDDADNPIFIETVPRKGYRFIAPVTFEDLIPMPVAEPPAQLAQRAPATEQTDIPLPEVTATRIRTRILYASAAAIILLVVALAWLLVRDRGRSRLPTASSSAPAESNRRSLAILGFQNASGRSDEVWLSTALTEMLRTELASGNRVRVIPGENVTQFRLSEHWSDADSLSPATAARIGKVLDGDLLLLGSYVAVGEAQQGAIRVDFRLQQSHTGEILYEGAETGTVKQLFGLVAKIGATLRQRLGLPLSTESEEVAVISSLPSDPAANRFYSLGLQKLREADVATAKDLFLQAEKLAPEFPLVHLMLSRAWSALGYDQNSRTEIKKAFSQSSTLPDADKLQVEGAYYQSLKDLDKAAASYRALFALYPDSVDYAEQLVIVLNAAGHREEALAIVQKLRQLPPPASDDPRIDFWQAKLISYSDTKASGPFIARAIAQAAARGQKLLYAHFRMEECLGLTYGEGAQTPEAGCQEAYDIFMATGNRLYAADALRIMGDRRGSQGDFNGAHEMYERALAMLRELGEHEKMGTVLNNMGVAAENQGQIKQAEKLFREAKRNFEDCSDTLNAAVAQGNIGDVLLARGDLRNAEKQYQDARQSFERVAAMEVEYDLYSIAEIRLLEGDIPSAKRYASQAADVAERRGTWQDMAQSRSNLGDIAVYEGDLAGAKNEYERALSIWQKAGAKNNVAQVQASLADVALEEKKYDEAEKGLRVALAQFQAEQASVSIVLAETDLSRVLLAKRSISEARKTISDAITWSRTSRDPNVTLSVAVQDARIEAAEIVATTAPRPDLSATRRKLERIISSSRKLGYYLIECDARLALAEIDVRDSRASAMRQLAALADETRSRGLNLLATKAAELMK